MISFPLIDAPTVALFVVFSLLKINVHPLFPYNIIRLPAHTCSSSSSLLPLASSSSSLPSPGKTLYTGATHVTSLTLTAAPPGLPHFSYREIWALFAPKPRNSLLAWFSERFFFFSFFLPARCRHLMLNVFHKNRASGSTAKFLQPIPVRRGHNSSSANQRLQDFQAISIQHEPFALPG